METGGGNVGEGGWSKDDEKTERWKGEAETRGRKAGEGGGNKVDEKEEARGPGAEGMEEGEEGKRKEKWRAKVEGEGGGKRRGEYGGGWVGRESECLEGGPCEGRGDLVCDGRIGPGRLGGWSFKVVKVWVRSLKSAIVYTER